MLPRLPIANRIRLQWNHSLWLLILLLSWALQAGGLVADWRFDRALIAQGDVWLLFSGHFVHLNWTHWALNMAGLAVVAFFFSPYSSVWQWLWVIFIAALFVGLGLYWRNPELHTYVGLSGVLHGLFIYGAMRETRRYPASGYVLLALLVGKLIWEFMNGPLPGSETMTQGRVATDAHLYGAFGGAFAGLVLSSRTLFDQLVKVKNR
jgi:rhomboid family GlyGly-CTERM serine protease